MRDLTTTSYAILGLLTLQPWSAYELAKQMKRSLRFCWPRAESAVYEEPKNLVAHGLAKSRRQRSGVRTRTVYSITEEGREAFGRWMGQPSAPPQLESEALVRVMFAEQGTKEDLLGALRSLQDHAHQLQRSMAERAVEYFETGGPFPERLHIIGMAGKFVVDYSRMLEGWARWAESQLDRWPDFGPLPPETATEEFRVVLDTDLDFARQVLEGSG
jgi:PadR family transcriptional regulator AphA